MIYYVEDDTNIRDLTVYALKQAGFEAAGFTCGRDFFKACDEKSPDLVLLDIMLPEMDGLEILRELRSLPSTKNIPVMMLTAKGTEFDKVCGLDAGAVGDSKSYAVGDPAARAGDLVYSGDAGALFRITADADADGLCKLECISLAATRDYVDGKLAALAALDEVMF